MSDQETRLVATMRNHDAAAPIGAELSALINRRQSRLRRRRSVWLTAAVASCLVLGVGGASAYVSFHHPANGTVSTSSPAGVSHHGAGPHAQPHAQPIVRALVSADGRTVTVPATGGGCVTGAHLTATETPTQVALDLSRQMSTSAVCPSNVVALQAAAVLAQPLGARPLIDQSTDRKIPYIPGQDLAVPGWLPPGAGHARDAVMDGWARTYTFPTGDRTAPLQIIENPGRFANPLQFTASQSSSTTVSVDGIPAQLVVERAASGRLEEVFVGWVAGRYSIIVSSMPTYAGQHALAPEVVMRVARDLHVPSAAQ